MVVVGERGQGGGWWSGATVGRVVREERKRANIAFKG